MGICKMSNGYEVSEGGVEVLLVFVLATVG